LNKYIKLIAANLCIAILAVILYSPGLICLRISDYSIFLAGMSIIAALALIGAFFFINLRLLKEPDQKPVTLKDVPDLDRAKDILKSHWDSKYFGSTKGTMSWDKFNSVAEAAETAAIKNVVAMANRMRLFDEKEYARLQHYREDDIPDDIQEEQLKLYQKNSDNVRSTISLNEKILLKLDALAMEVSSSASGEDADLNNDLLNEIGKLIDETKYYQ